MIETRREKVAYSIIFILALIISYGLGFSAGVKTTINEAVDIGIILLERQKINITIDEEMIKFGIWQYENNIGGCFFAE